MPNFDQKTPPYKKRKDIKANWPSFKKGLNLLLRASELDREELSQSDNIMLEGKGVATGRWGTETYFSIGVTGTVLGLGTFKNSSTDEILGITDQGYLYKKNGTGSTVITGQSWPSGTTVRTEQLGGETYLVSPDVTFTKYTGSSLIAFATISPPTGLYATNFSGASGPNRVSYKVLAVGVNGGTTTPGTNYVLPNLPFAQNTTQVHLFWTAPSAASFSGFEIYRGTEGDEGFLAAVGPSITKYVDNGEPTAFTILPPVTNTTGGVKSKFIKKYKDRLLIVNKDEPTKLLISGRYPYHTKFSYADGGGFIFINPDDGDDITGIEIQPIADRIVVYKNNSSHLVELSTVTIGNFVILDPQYQPISTATGCSGQDSIATVENDTFYFGRKGVYVTGYEPNFLNIIRTNEISAKVRPYLELLNETDYNTANAMYVNNKYILSFPQRKEMIVYDRERGAWLGPWKTPYGVSKMLRYVDDTGSEKWVLGSYNSNQTYNFNMSLNTDDGTAITKTLRTNKEYFDDWTVLNNIKFFYILFASITGEATVNLIVENRDGTSSTIKSFTITGAEVSGKTGWGMNKWGLIGWGLSTGSAVAQGSELTRWASVFKQARFVQTEVTATSASSNFDLLEITITASKQSEGSLASSQRV